MIKNIVFVFESDKDQLYYYCACQTNKQLDWEQKLLLFRFFNLFVLFI